MLHSVRRAAALVAAPALATFALVAAPTSASATPAPASGPVLSASNWLAAQVPTSGIVTTSYVYNGVTYSYDDYGLTIDVALALHSAGGHDQLVAGINHAVSESVDSYTAPGYGTVVAAGATAKALALAQAAGDVSQYATDLRSSLESTVATSGNLKGRIQDTLDPADEFATDYSNTIGQSFAAMVLDASGSTQSGAVTDYLLDQQCAAGYFRQSFAAPDAADQTCDGGNGKADVDATGLAIRSLIGQADDAVVGSHINDAADWLLSMQRADGSFAAGADIATPNANSTGLAGAALALAGQPSAAARAATWLRSHQLSNVGSCAAYAKADAFAIAYDGAALVAAKGKTLTPVTVDQYRRATAQAIPALLSAPAGTGAKATSVTGFVRAGTKQRVSVTGAAPGEALCGTTGSQKLPAVATATGTAQFTVTLPKRSATTVVTVSKAGGVAGKATIKALAAKKLPVAVKGKVRKGKVQTVRVSGLAPGESVTVKVLGKTKHGKAGATGVYTAKVKATGKPRKAKVTVVGQFANRKNSKTFKVVR